jgi:hypothetical protein
VGAAAQRRRSVDHGPSTGKPPREQRGVLVLGRHDRAKPPHAPEIGRGGKGNQRPQSAVGRVTDGPLSALRQPGEPGILAAPDLLGITVWLRCQQRCGIEAPVGGSVDTARDVKLRYAPEVLHANQEERLGPDLGGPRVEDGVGRVGQVLNREDGIAWAAFEEPIRLRRSHSGTCTGTASQVCASLVRRS